MRGSAAHQRAFDNNPNHGAADTGNKTPAHPAPESHHHAQPDTTRGEDQRGKIIATVKPNAFN